MNEPLSPHPEPAALDDFVDGYLDAVASAHVAAHVAACEHCARAVSTTRELLASSREMRGAVHAPRELWARIAASTIHVRAARRQALRELRGVLIAAALALVVLTAVLTWKIARSEVGGRPTFGAPAAPSAPQPPAPD